MNSYRFYTIFFFNFNDFNVIYNIYDLFKKKC